MRDDYFAELLVKLDLEMQALQAQQAPDQEEFKLNQRVDADPDDLDALWELAEHLVNKGRLEDSVGLLLELISKDKAW